MTQQVFSLTFVAQLAGDGAALARCVGVPGGGRVVVSGWWRSAVCGWVVVSVRVSMSVCRSLRLCSAIGCVPIGYNVLSMRACHPGPERDVKAFVTPQSFATTILSVT